jgi:hypothetical protein
MKKKIGRPKKNNTLDFNVPLENNLNSKNIWPINKIKSDKELKKPHKNYKYLVYFKSDNSKIFESILSIIGGRYIYLHFIFDETGLSLKHHSEDILSDISQFKCKILHDKLLDYRIKKKTEFKIELKELHKIFKSIPSKTPFSFLVGSNNKSSSLYLDIVYNDNNKKNRFGTSISNILTNAENNIQQYNYDLIILIEASIFAKECENIKRFSNILEMSYSKNIFTMSCKANKITYSCSFEANNKTILFKENISKPIISNIFSLSSFNKYVKFAKISNMVKIYMKNSKPLIIEYDLKDKIIYGVTQILVSPQQNINI